MTEKDKSFRLRVYQSLGGLGLLGLESGSAGAEAGLRKCSGKGLTAEGGGFS